MGVRNASVGSRALVNSGVGNSVEVIIFTSPGINLPVDNALVLVFWEVVCTLGAAQTAFAINLRRGTAITGILINGGSTITTVASTTVRFGGVQDDTPGIVANQQYSLGVNANGAASAGTIVDGRIEVIVL